MEQVVAVDQPRHLGPNANESNELRF
jgi:hypothetical protein